MRVNIGIMADEDYKANGDKRMFPNDNFSKYFPEIPVRFLEESAFSCSIKIGFDMIADKVLETSGMGAIIKEIYKDDADVVINLIKYIVANETTVFQHYPTKMHNYPVGGGKLVSDSYICKFNKDERNYERALKFYSEWNRLRSKDEIIWFSYDATNVNNQSGNITYTEDGHPKVDVGTPQINIAVAMDLEENLPLFPEVYSGSIPDIAQFRYMVDKAIDYGYSQFGILCDRGYFSKSNVMHCDKKHLEFMFMLKGNLDAVKGSVSAAMNKIQRARDEFLIDEHKVFGTTVKGPAFSGDTKDRYFHVYFDGQRNAEECLKILAELKDQEAQLEKLLSDGSAYTKKDLKGYSKRFDIKYDAHGKFISFSKNQKAVNKEMREAGYFVIITSTEMTASRALSIYRDRDVSEKLFETMKNELGFDAVYVSSDISLQNKLFLVFVATILRIFIYNGLEALRKTNRKDNTVTAAINYMQTEAVS